MTALIPGYLKQPSNGGDPGAGTGSHTLTNAEYASFLLVKDLWALVTDIDGRIITTNSGEFVLGTH